MRLLAQQAGNESEAVELGISAIDRFRQSGHGPPSSMYRALFDAVTADAHRIHRIKHDGKLNTGSLSSDDRFLVLAGQGRSAQIYNTNTWKLVASIPVVPSSFAVSQIAVARFAFKAHRLVTACRSERGIAAFQVWDFLEEPEFRCKLIREFECKTEALAQADLSADGKYLVTNGDSSTAIVWDVSNGSRIILRGHSGAVTNISFSSDVAGSDRYIVSIGDSLQVDHDKSIRVWDARTGACLMTIRPNIQGENFHPISVAFSHFSELIFVGSQEGGLISYYGPAAAPSQWGKEARRYHGAYGTVQDLHDSGDSFWLAAANARGNVQVWYIPEMMQPMQTLATRTLDARSVQFSKSGRTLVTTTQFGYADIWLLNQLTYNGARGTIYYADCSPDGSELTAASIDGAVHIWHLNQNIENSVESRGFRYDPIRSIQFNKSPLDHSVYSPDGSKIAIAAADGSVHVINRDQLEIGGRTAVQLSGHTGRVWTVFFSHDNKKLVTASQDKTVRVWDSVTGHQIAQWSLPSGSAFVSAVFEQDGTHILAAANDGSAYRYNTSLGSVDAVYQLPGHRGYPTEYLPWSAVYSPDERFVLTADGDGKAYLFGTLHGNLVGVIHASDIPLFSAMFSPDGRRLVTTGADGSTRIWRLPASFVTAPFNLKHPELVVRGNGLKMNIARFTPNGKYVVTAGEDQLVHMYPVTEAEIEKVARTILMGSKK